MLQFVCDAVKDMGKEEYLRLFIHIGLDWIGRINVQWSHIHSMALSPDSYG